MAAFSRENSLVAIGCVQQRSSLVSALPWLDYIFRSRGIVLSQSIRISGLHRNVTAKEIYSAVSQLCRCGSEDLILGPARSAATPPPRQTSTGSEGVASICPLQLTTHSAWTVESLLAPAAVRGCGQLQRGRTGCSRSKALRKVSRSTDRNGRHADESRRLAGQEFLPCRGESC